MVVAYFLGLPVGL